MTEQQATEILKCYIKANNSLHSHGKYVCYPIRRFDDDGEPREGNDITLDATFTLEELEAIVWWMRNKPVQFTP